MTNLCRGTVLRERYEIQGLLNSGGMSVLYRAVDRHLPGDWVVKEMRNISPTPQDREAILAQFRREAAILAQLSHPGLPRVIDCFEENGRLYLVEEFLAGDNLMEVARHQRFSEEDAVHCACQLLDVLVYLHQNHIIYRDLKPDNVILGADGRYRLVDFGIARLFSVGKRRDTVLMGTPGFASPEHYGNRQTDERSDLYSLGATLHFLVTGRDPGENPFLFEHPEKLVEGISEWFSDIVMTALETEPDDRFTSAEEMREALQGPRHLVRRARTFTYARRPSFLPPWERPLQAAAALPGALGLLAIGSLGLPGLPVGLAFLVAPTLLLARYGEEYARTHRKRYVTTPRELQVWEGDRVLKLAWSEIVWVKVHKYQRFFRLARDLGAPQSVDTTIRVASVEVCYHEVRLNLFQRMQTTFRFTSELEGWNDLLGIILARTGLRPVSRFASGEADEEYRR